MNVKLNSLMQLLILFILVTILLTVAQSMKPHHNTICPDFTLENHS